MKLSKLSDAIAMEFGEPHGTVALKHRLLREAGKLSTGGRGRGGAEMNERDLAVVLLAEMSFAEPTSIVPQFTAVENLPLRSCEWTDMKEGARGLGEQERRFPYIHHVSAPISFGADIPATALDGLSRVLKLQAEGRFEFQIEHVELRADKDGVSLEIDHWERQSYAEAVAAMIRQTKDRSDTMRFPNELPADDPLWRMNTQFTLYEGQRSVKSRSCRLPGASVRRLVSEVLT